MTTFLSSNDIEKLVFQSAANPFLCWPNLDRNKATLFLSKLVLEEFDLGENFYFLKDNRLVLYFQIQDLPWDSQHFGYKCGKVTHFYIDEEISFEEVEKIRHHAINELVKFLKKVNIRFLSADISSLSKNGNYFIQSIGFRFILSWIDGIWIPQQLEKGKFALNVRLILPEEVDLFSKISTNSYFRDGRFYFDKMFDQRQVDNLYGEVVKNAYLSNDILLSCMDGDIPVGIFICKKIKTYKDFNNLKVAHLRFLLINPDYRNMSCGYSLFRSTLEYLRFHSDLITTGLESHNIISMNLHSKMNFKFTYSHNDYHFWNL